MKSPWRVNSQRALHGEVNKHRIYLSSSDSETLANVCIHDITRCRGDQLPWRQFAVYLQFLFSAEVFFPSSTLQLGETEAGGATGYVIAADDCNVQSRFCQPDGLTFTSDCMTLIVGCGSVPAAGITRGGNVLLSTFDKFDYINKHDWIIHKPQRRKD